MTILNLKRWARAGSNNLRGRLRTADLLIRVARLVRKFIVFSISKALLYNADISNLFLG